MRVDGSLAFCPRFCLTALEKNQQESQGEFHIPDGTTVTSRLPCNNTTVWVIVSRWAGEQGRRKTEMAYYPGGFQWWHSGTVSRSKPSRQKA